ncbi:MAG TPA: DUF2244 domain-containing protein [Alphaproteobacteria bacterium]|jgi:uncharacterized membrane protein
MTVAMPTAADAASGPSASATETILFDAVLRPNRSLSPRGFLLLMLVLGGCSFAAGMVFVINGAWPVFGFFGLDVLAVYVAFRINYRSGRNYEAVRLTERQLSVMRVDWRGQQRQLDFQPYWLRVEIDEPVTQGSQVLLVSHGRSAVVGSFLSPAERADFATALRGALAGLRHVDPSAGPPASA